MTNSLIKRLLPYWLYHRLIGSWDKNGFKKYFHNTSWMFLARGVTFLTSFFTIAIVARYLGPENLGKLSYAQSFVSILSVLASLGINQILYRDLTAEPERQNEFLGTAIISQLFFGTLAFFASIIISIWIGNASILTTLIAITAFTFIINPLGTIGILFQARVEAKYSSQITIFLAFFIPALKLLIVFFDKGIIYFSLILLVEAGLSTIWAIYIYIAKLHLNPLNWRFTWIVFMKLMRDSWPFLFAGLFGYIYARVDQVMLQHYLGSTSVGFYDVAVRVSNLWSFIPALIITSVFPAIVSARKTGKDIYLERLKSLTVLIGFITLTITLGVFIFSKLIILIIFGSQYIDSVVVLKIYVWSGALAILGILVQQYLIAENKGWVHLLLTLAGAIINIVLNLYMIPRYGMLGAAISTLFSYAMVPFGLLLFRKSRKDIYQMFKC